MSTRTRKSTHRPTPDKIAAYEKEIQKKEENLTGFDKELEALNGKIADELVKYSQSYRRNFGKSLETEHNKEEQVQSNYYNELEALSSAKNKWRKALIRLCKDPSKLKNYSQFGLNLLKLKENHPFILEDTKGEGFGGFDLQENEIVIHKEKELGRGSFGVVYDGVCRGKDVAVKLVKNLQLEAKLIEEFKKECIIMRSLPHPNILLFLGACMTPGFCLLVTEKAPNGSLAFISKPNTKIKLGFSRKLQIAKEIAEGVNWLHKQNPPLLHLDLKPGNVLLMEDWTVKIADFGMSRLKPSEGKSEEFVGFGGTLLYMPPEMFTGNTLPSEKCDVYAYGILLWELLTETVPYGGKYKNQLHLMRDINQGIRPEIPNTMPASLANLIKICWNQDSTKRPHFSDILQGNYFNIALREAIASGEKLAEQLWSQFNDESGKVLEEVDWERFKNVFCSVMNIDPKARVNDLQALHAILGVDERKGRVTNQTFQNFVRWFKPLRATGDGPSTIDDVAALAKAKWFFGEMSAQQAEQLLKGHKTGTFLVRFSAHQDGQFSVSFLVKDRIKKLKLVSHMRLEELNTIASLHSRIKQLHKQLKWKQPHPHRPVKYIVLSDNVEVRYLSCFTTNSSSVLASSDSSKNNNDMKNSSASYCQPEKFNQLVEDADFDVEVENFAWGDEFVVY